MAMFSRGFSQAWRAKAFHASQKAKNGRSWTPIRVSPPMRSTNVTAAKPPR